VTHCNCDVLQEIISAAAAAADVGDDDDDNARLEQLDGSTHVLPSADVLSEIQNTHASVINKQDIGTVKTQDVEVWLSAR